MIRFRHLILTRFNIRIDEGGPPGLEWLEHRCNIFERFCLPSLRSQTNRDFDWILFCNPEMPPEFLRRIRSYAEWRAVQPIYFRSIFAQAMVRAAIAHLVKGYSHVITTRLDNDDAISRTFVERVQEQFHGQEFEFLNPINGYIWKDGRLYSGQNRSSPFMSLVERAEDYATVYCGNHVDLHCLGPVVQMDGPEAWLQVVHGRNLVNDAWGTPVPIGSLYETFGIQPNQPR